MVRFGHVAAVFVGLGGFYFGFGPTVNGVRLASYKVRNKARNCGWRELASVPANGARFAALQSVIRERSRVVATDAAAGISRVETPSGGFWVKSAGTEMAGPDLIPYLLAEQQWLRENRPEWSVRPGEVVADIGAHVGVFTAQALRLGAAKVIAVEPDPVNVICLRRNFEREIATGRVLIVPEGAWDSVQEIEFHQGDANSGTGSFVLETGSRGVRVPVRPLDDMLSRLGVPRATFIKMDIEGAEREALRGAAKTIRAWGPRMMLDAYHRADDQETLPEIIHGLRASYQMTWGPCALEEEKGEILPHSIFFE
jgi:FkbM family methyltransferase